MCFHVQNLHEKRYVFMYCISAYLHVYPHNIIMVKGLFLHILQQKYAFKVLYLLLYHITSHPRCLIGAEAEYKGSYTTFMFSCFIILLLCFHVL